jgi:hypothetical protein
MVKIERIPRLTEQSVQMTEILQQEILSAITLLHNSERSLKSNANVSLLIYHPKQYHSKTWARQHSTSAH